MVTTLFKGKRAKTVRGEGEKGLCLGIVSTTIYLGPRVQSTKINHFAERKHYIPAFAI